MSRRFSVLFVFALLVVTPALLAVTSTPAVSTDQSLVQAPSKVCHPKKPITCRAAQLPAMQFAAQTQWVTPNATPATAPDASKLGQETNRVCFPPRYICKSQPFEAPKVKPATTPEPSKVGSDQDLSRVCFPPRYICKARGI